MFVGPNSFGGDVTRRKRANEFAPTKKQLLNVTMAKADLGLEQRIAAVRRFNRFYTQRIGVLREHLLDSPFPLTGVRVLYELAHWPATGESATAAGLAARLALDEGYLSGMLRGFGQRRLVHKKPSSVDRRRKSLALSERGR